MELSLSSESPCFIRYANCSQTVSEDAYSDDGFILYDKESLSKALCFIVTYGRLYSEALLAKGALAAFDISCSVIALEQLLPLSYPLEALKEVLEAADPRAPLLFAEEGVLHGGLSEALTGALIKEGCLSERKYIIKAVRTPCKSIKSTDAILYPL